MNRKSRNTPAPISSNSRSPIPPPKPPPNNRLPRSPPNARPARPPMMPPNQPREGCGAGVGVVGVGEVRERDGLDGVVGEAGADDEREPRLPPLPARANASPACRASSAASVRAPTVSIERRIAHLPCIILARRSRNQQHLARRLAPLERAVRVGRVLERELELHPQLQLAITHPAEQVGGPLLQLLAGGDVGVEARTREEQRALGVEDLRIDLTDRAARLAIERDEPARRQAVEAAIPGVLADGVVDHLQAFAAGDALDL